MKKIFNCKDFGFPAALWAVHVTVSVIVMFIFTHAVIHGPHASQRVDEWFHSFAAWDGAWYIRIAENGYDSILMTAFFPFYPLLIRMFHMSGLSYTAAAIILSNLAFLAALILLFKVAKLYVDEQKARWALLLLICFPTAFFFNMAYTESLTLLLTVLFFYLLHKDKFYLALVTGLVMSANKQIGAFLSIIGMIYLVRNRTSYSAKAFWLRLVSLCVIPLGLFAFMTYLYSEFGDAFAFVQAQEYWHRQPMIPIVDTLRYMLNLLRQSDGDPYFWNYKIIMLLNGTLQLLVAGILLWMFVDRRKVIPIEMKLFALLSFLLASTSGTYGNLQSLGRFMLVIFPVFIMWADLFKRENVLIGTLFIMFAIKVLLLGMFGSGYEIT